MITFIPFLVYFSINIILSFTLCFDQKKGKLIIEYVPFLIILFFGLPLALYIVAEQAAVFLYDYLNIPILFKLATRRYRGIGIKALLEYHRLYANIAGVKGFKAWFDRWCIERIFKQAKLTYIPQD